MTAPEKMQGFGLKALAHAAGKDLATIYRWRNALKSGRSIRDEAKHVLIAATAGSAHAISWADFFRGTQR